MLERRSFIRGMLGLLAAPAIIRTPGLLMPVKRVLCPDEPVPFFVSSSVQIGSITTNGTWTAYNTYTDPLLRSAGPYLTFSDRREMLA